MIGANFWTRYSSSDAELRQSNHEGLEGVAYLETRRDGNWTRQKQGCGRELATMTGTCFDKDLQQIRETGGCGRELVTRCTEAELDRGYELVTGCSRQSQTVDKARRERDVVEAMQGKTELGATGTGPCNLRAWGARPCNTRVRGPGTRRCCCCRPRGV